jgi:hypothetical protein
MAERSAVKMTDFPFFGTFWQKWETHPYVLVKKSTVFTPCSLAQGLPTFHIEMHLGETTPWRPVSS